MTANRGFEIRSRNDADGNFVTTRYNSDGSLDTAFGADGTVIAPMVGSGGGARSVAIQPAGKVVVAGTGSCGSGNDMAVARHNTDGTPDEWFGRSGTVTTDIAGGSITAFSAAFQPDGKLVPAGTAFDP